MTKLLRCTDLFNKNIFKRSASLLTTFVVLTNVHAQTNVWTWVSGDNTTNNTPVYGTQGIPAAANKPGERDGQAKWMDAAGNLWFFGGEDHNFDYYNDLWKYTKATGQWTWVSGNPGTYNSGVYGTKGVVAAGNIPGARSRSVSWTDAAGDLWLFGGYGVSTALHALPMLTLYSRIKCSARSFFSQGFRTFLSGHLLA